MIALAILRFIENEKCVVEGAGACGLAAIMAGQLNEFKGKRYYHFCGDLMFIIMFLYAYS